LRKDQVSFCGERNGFWMDMNSE